MLYFSPSAQRKKKRIEEKEERLVRILCLKKKIKVNECVYMGPIYSKEKTSEGHLSPRFFFIFLPLYDRKQNGKRKKIKDLGRGE